MNSEEWSLIAGASSFFLSLMYWLAGGVVLDKVLIKRYRVGIYRLLEDAWIRLDEMRVPDLPKRASRLVLKLLVGVCRPFRGKPILFFIATLLFSWLLTTAVSMAVVLTYSVDFSMTLVAKNLPFYTLYFVNFIFDAVTISFTVVALKIVAKARWWVGVCAIIADIAAAYLLWVLCWVAMVFANQYTAIHSVPGKQFQGAGPRPNPLSVPSLLLTDTGDIQLPNHPPPWVVEDVMTANGLRGGSIVVELDRRAIFAYAFSHLSRCIVHRVEPLSMPVYITIQDQGRKLRARARAVEGFPDWYLTFLAGTSAIPTLFNLVFLLFLACAKVVLHISHKLCMHYCEMVTDEKPENTMPFTKLAAVLSVVFWLLQMVTKLRGI